MLEKSPLVVGLVRKGYEVLLCDDPIDEVGIHSIKVAKIKKIKAGLAVVNQNELLLYFIFDI